MDWNDRVIAEFLAGEERIADTFDRQHLLLLDTTGARSGQRRTSPVAALARGDGRILVAASKAGADTHPAWFHNLVADPTVGVRRWEDGDLASYSATAVVLEGEARDQAWAEIVAWSPGFAQYQTRTDRVIPVVELIPHR